MVLRYRRILVALGALSAGLIAWPTVGAAQTVTGYATAVRATTIGLLGSTTTELAGTGTLSGSTDARGSFSVVNALHVILDGVADVVIGSATAAIQ